jgi:hypothetical protein
MTCGIIAHLLTCGLGIALNAAAAWVVCIQHPKFALLAVCEFQPLTASTTHKLVRSFAGAARCLVPRSPHRDTPARDR